MKLKSDIVNLIVRVEHHLCPQYCGVVDRRRIIAFLLLTISELIIIPYHIMLFLVMKESYGLSLCCLIHSCSASCSFWSGNGRLLS